MTRTFLTTIELPDDADVNAEADNILDLLLEDYNVTSVKPWSSPDTSLSADLYRPQTLL